MSTNSNKAEANKVEREYGAMIAEEENEIAFIENKALGIGPLYLLLTRLLPLCSFVAQFGRATMSLRHGLIAMAAMATMGGSAHAITATIDITASRFTLDDGDGSVAPIDPAIFDFTISLDPGVTVGPTTDGLIVNFTNLPYPVSYTYDGNNVLVIATNPFIDGCSDTPSSLCIFVYDALTSEADATVLQETSSGGTWSARHGVTTTSVPEPASWALLLLGLGMGGAAVRASGRERGSA